MGILGGTIPYWLKVIGLWDQFSPFLNKFTCHSIDYY